MVEIKCITKDAIKLTDCTPFQGNLKKRTQQDIEELKQSLLTEGLLMPFAVWKKDDKNYLLDGHGRKEALVQLAVEDAQLLSVDWPCVFINAETEDEARKALLQITSSYGKITKAGVKQFTVSIPNYVAPSIKKFVPKIKSVSVTDNKKEHENPAQDKAVLKIRVMRDKLEEVRNILSQFNFIEVL